MTKDAARSDEGLTVEGVALARGTRVETRLRTLELADGSWVELPVILLRGKAPGPVFYLGAAFHGDEVNGVEIATRLAGEIDPVQLSGTLIVAPAQNPLALQAQHRYFVGHFLKSPLDQSPADPWVSFPGEADGNMAAQIAHKLFTQLIRHADYLIDIHTPTTGGRYAPFAFLPPPGAGEAARRAEAMAEVFGADFILSTEQGLYVSEQSPHVVMARRGATAMGVELGEGGRLEAEITQQGLRGLRNVLRWAGMLPGEVERFGARQVIRTMHVVRSHRGGLVHRRVGLGDTVGAGDVVATITNLFGEETEQIRAPIGGPIVRIATFPIVSAGERIVQIGVLR
ncbi:MAG TPA: succinylglutamate desuccinylase/aspartoacylase family protein [Stellaceae bacterium]|nr:succinylglutamate desuccinylase/aspartoacylase family protein [Stellaceae bacterium]